MRATLQVCAGLILIIALSIAISFAQTTNPSSAAGNWKWSVNVEGGQSFDQSAKLKQDGDKITGTFTDGFDSSTFDIKEGKSKDGQLSFTVVRPVGDASITLNFNGKIDQDNVKGKIEVKFGDEPISMNWDAKRTADDKPATKPAP